MSPATGVRAPASFTIGAGGALRPTAISVPGGIPIQLQVRNLDRHPHALALESTVRVAVAAVVPPGARDSTVDHLSNGSYRVLIDGRTRATLVIGGQPGP